MQVLEKGEESHASRPLTFPILKDLSLDEDSLLQQTRANLREKIHGDSDGLGARTHNFSIDSQSIRFSKGVALELADNHTLVLAAEPVPDIHTLAET